MMQSLKKFITPTAADEGIDRRMVLVVLGFALVAVALLFAVDINRQLMGVLGLLLLVNFLLAWYGVLQPAGLMVPILGLAAFTYLIFTNDGLRDTAILGLVAVDHWRRAVDRQARHGGICCGEPDHCAHPGGDGDHQDGS